MIPKILVMANPQIMLPIVFPIEGQNGKVIAAEKQAKSGTILHEERQVFSGLGHVCRL